MKTCATQKLEAEIEEAVERSMRIHGASSFHGCEHRHYRAFATVTVQLHMQPIPFPTWTNLPVGVFSAI